jgi:hypothetical protein
MFKIINISKDNRKCRIHKTAQAYFLRPGEEVIVPYPLVVDRPDCFKVIDLSKTELKEKEEEPRKKKNYKEVKQNDK